MQNEGKSDQTGPNWAKSINQVCISNIIIQMSLYNLDGAQRGQLCQVGANLAKLGPTGAVYLLPYTLSLISSILALIFLSLIQYVLSPILYTHSSIHSLSPIPCPLFRTPIHYPISINSYSLSLIPYPASVMPYVISLNCLSLISYPLFFIPYPLSFISYLLSLILYLLSIILYPLFLIPYPLSPISYPLSHIPYQLSLIP